MRSLKNKTVLAFLGAALAVFATLGSAEAMDVPLTNDKVTRFLESFGEMRSIAIGEGLKTGTDPEATKNPIGTVLKALKSSKLRTGAQAVAVNHGFADLKEWSDTGRAIAHAYLFVTAGSSREAAKAALEKHKDDAVKALDKLGLLNGKQKQQLRANLDSASEQLADEPPPDNVAIVQEMRADIEAAVKLGAY